MHAALRTQPHTAPNMPPNGGGFGVVLRTFCGRPAARSSPPSPPQTSPVTAAHSAPANAGVTVTPAARPASCTPAPAQHGPARAVVSGRPVLRKLLLKWGLGWVSAAASAGGAEFTLNPGSGVGYFVTNRKKIFGTHGGLDMIPKTHCDHFCGPTGKFELKTCFFAPKNRQKSLKSSFVAPLGGLGCMVVPSQQVGHHSHMGRSAS